MKFKIDHNIYAGGAAGVFPIVERHERVTKHHSVLATAEHLPHEQGIRIGVYAVGRMRHVGRVVGREIVLLRIVPIRIVHHRAVGDKASVAINATQFLIVATRRFQASLAAGKHRRHQGAATNVNQRGAIGKLRIVRT